MSALSHENHFKTDHLRKKNDPYVDISDGITSAKTPSSAERNGNGLLDLCRFKFNQPQSAPDAQKGRENTAHL
ncbi:unnamed protein product [Boreogadus saida]